MKVLQFICSHAALRQLLCEDAITRLLAFEDLGRKRDQYLVTVLIRDDALDRVIELASDRPRWVKWPEL